MYSRAVRSSEKINTVKKPSAGQREVRIQQEYLFYSGSSRTSISAYLRRLQKKAFCMKLGLRDTQTASAQLKNKTEICSAGRGENGEEMMFYRRVEWCFCFWFFLLGHAGWEDSPVLTAPFQGWVQSQDELREGRRVVSGKHRHQ